MSITVRLQFEMTFFPGGLRKYMYSEAINVDSLKSSSFAPVDYCLLSLGSANVDPRYMRRMMRGPTLSARPLDAVVAANVPYPQYGRKTTSMATQLREKPIITRQNTPVSPSHIFNLVFYLSLVPLIPPKQKLQVVGCQGFNRLLVGVDGRVDHRRLLLLQPHHSALDRVLDAEPRDDAGPRLADAMTPVRRLPLRGGIPPAGVC